MTGRLTVAKVRKMSDKQLMDVWWNGAYPFDGATCCYCLTSHAIQKCYCDEHAGMTKEIPPVCKDGDDIRGEIVPYIRQNLVKLFALRRKYARFYKKVKP